MSENKYGQKVVTPAEKAAQKAFRDLDATKAITEHENAQKAFHKNRERLKSERLAREAAAPLAAATKAKPKKKTK
jgi:hypothetical protein